MTGIPPELLTTFKFFKGMESAMVERFARAGSDVKFAPDDMIFREGDVAAAAFLIRSGDAALEQHIPGMAHHVIQTLHSGEIVGWSWLFPPHRCRFDARALTELVTYRFEGEPIRNSLAEEPAFAAVVYERWGKLLVGRLESARLQLVDIYAQRD